MMNIPGKLRIMVDNNIRFGGRKFPIWFGVENMNGGIHHLKQMVFEDNDDPGTVGDFLFLQEDTCQSLINDLYRIGFRPSDEIKKDDLIKTLQKEIEKRDKWKDEWEAADNYMVKILKQELDKKDKIIEDLMNQFVLKGNDPGKRSIIT